MVWDWGEKGFIFELVQYDKATNVLGRVDKMYADQGRLVREITEAHVKWGVPTAKVLLEAFPNGSVRA